MKNKKWESTGIKGGDYELMRDECKMISLFYKNEPLPYQIDLTLKQDMNDPVFVTIKVMIK